MAARSRGNATLTFDSNALTAYCTEINLTGDGERIEVTDLASTAKEFIAGDVEWGCEASGQFAATLDGYLGPVVGDGTAYTLAAAFTEGGSTITYTWTTNAELISYNPAASVGDVITWSASWALSGAPVRTP